MRKKRVGRVAPEVAKPRRRSVAAPPEEAKPKKRMLKLGINHKKAMEILEATLRTQRQKPPSFLTSFKDPYSKFFIDLHALVAQWPEKVLRTFAEELTRAEIPKDLGSVVTLVRRLLMEIFDGSEDGNRPFYLARWRMWPYRSDRPVNGPSESVTDKETEMASKLAQKKKKGVSKKKLQTKKTGKKAKTASSQKGGGKDYGLKDDTKLVVVKDSREPGLEGRRKIKKAIPPAGITVAKLMEKTGARISTLNAMITKGFIKKA